MAGKQGFGYESGMSFSSDSTDSYDVESVDGNSSDGWGTDELIMDLPPRQWLGMYDVGDSFADFFMEMDASRQGEFIENLNFIRSNIDQLEQRALLSKSDMADLISGFESGRMSYYEYCRDTMRSDSLKSSSYLYVFSLKYRNLRITPLGQLLSDGVYVNTWNMDDLVEIMLENGIEREIDGFLENRIVSIIKGFLVSGSVATSMGEKQLRRSCSGKLIKLINEVSIELRSKSSVKDRNINRIVLKFVRDVKGREGRKLMDVSRFVSNFENLDPRRVKAPAVFGGLSLLQPNEISRKGRIEDAMEECIFSSGITYTNNKAYSHVSNFVGTTDLTLTDTMDVLGTLDARGSVFVLFSSALTLKKLSEYGTPIMVMSQIVEICQRNRVKVILVSTVSDYLSKKTTSGPTVIIGSCMWIEAVDGLVYAQLHKPKNTVTTRGYLWSANSKRKMLRQYLGSKKEILRRLVKVLVSGDYASIGKQLEEPALLGRFIAPEYTPKVVNFDIKLERDTYEWKTYTPEEALENDYIVDWDEDFEVANYESTQMRERTETWPEPKGNSNESTSIGGSSGSEEYHESRADDEWAER